MDFSHFDLIFLLQRTPTKKTRLIPLKFGHPVKFRSSSFYEPTLTKKELRLRENSFVNDAISSSHKNRQYPTIPVYDALKDPYLVAFPLSRFVHKAFQISNEQRPIAKSKHPLSTVILRFEEKIRYFSFFSLRNIFESSRNLRPAMEN